MQLEHPTIGAWRELRPERAAPERIEVLEEDGQNTAVYRLVGAGKADTDIIAKRSRRGTARIERTIYEQILPNLPFPMLHYYGIVEEPDGEFWWLFIEDLGAEDKYLPQIKEHRVAAARWLGIMNRTTSRLAAAARLPGRGPGHYLNLLHSASGIIASNLANPALKVDDLTLLEGILAQCDYLSAHWGRLAAACERLPQTLVHGDFITKNVGVRNNGNGIILLPFDWEKAGWGTPAEDISRVDIATYWSTVSDHWPGLTIRTLDRLANVGKVFRCLVFLDWIAPRLAHGPIEQPIHDLRRCETWLDDLIRAARWED